MLIPRSPRIPAGSRRGRRLAWTALAGVTLAVASPELVAAGPPATAKPVPPIPGTLEQPSTAAPTDPFARFALPVEWEARFWSSPNAQALFALSPNQVADLVPVQSGVRYCRCPSCDADEADDPLEWSVARPRQ